MERREKDMKGVLFERKKQVRMGQSVGKGTEEERGRRTRALTNAGDKRFLASQGCHPASVSGGHLKAAHSAAAGSQAFKAVENPGRNSSATVTVMDVDVRAHLALLCTCLWHFSDVVVLV
ncbi:hypothetical protein NQZ68_027632 [Dissostichus eleginoides]|nr:hypothetical protein NQZ68_027632 [Dissostichus eleginoides]